MFRLFILITLFCLVGCDNGSPQSYTNTNSFDYKYSKTRFKMEGYSDKDSDAAARAIIKFNEAQKKRR